MRNIVLLHGALGASGDMQPLSEQLAALGHATFTFSFSGHGDTDLKEQFGIGEFTNELHEFIIARQISQPTLFGYSMGGYVALNYALLHPGTAGKIITLGTKFNWSAAIVERETNLLKPQKMLNKVPAFAEALRAKHGAKWDALVIRTASMMEDIGRRDLLRADRLKTIDTPVLVGLGDKDAMVSLEETREVCQSLPNAGMFMLAGTRHPIESVNTAFLAALIHHC